MLANFYNTSGAEINASLIALNLLLSLGLMVFIAWIYRRTHRGLSYSTSFLFTLLMIGLLGTTIMMVVMQNILGAFALLGAFGLIRFRTIVKDTRDVAFVFYALAIGIAVGVAAYSVAVIATGFIGAVILLTQRYHWRLDIRSSLNFILTITQKFSVASSDYEELLQSSGAHARLLSIKVSGEFKEYSYLLLLKNDREADKILQLVRAKADTADANIISAQEAWER